MKETKPYNISKHIVIKAYERIRRNGGASGVDKQSIAAFEIDLKNNLYKIWNRMSSGSYHPQAVMAVSIPRPDGGERVLLKKF